MRTMKMAAVAACILLGAGTARGAGPPDRPGAALAYQLALLEVFPAHPKVAGSGADRHVAALSYFGSTAEMKHLADFSRLEYLDFKDASNALEDADLEHLTKLRNLRRLDLGSQAHLTGEACRNLARLPRLERLVLDHCPKVRGAALAHLARAPRLRHLKCCTVTDAGLLGLSRCARLEHLAFEDGNITERGARAFARMGRLRTLVLRGTEMTAEAQLHFRHLTGLRALDVTDVDITDAGLRVITALPQLEWLRFSVRDDQKLSPEALASLSRMRRLRTLSVRNGDDRILDAISRCPSLVRLYFIAGEGATAGGVSLLGRCKTLRELRFVGKKVTDASIPHLIGMKGLRRLHMQNWSDASEELLRKARPDLEVDWANWFKPPED